jgi:LysM repeat protein
MGKDSVPATLREKVSSWLQRVGWLRRPEVLLSLGLLVVILALVGIIGQIVGSKPALEGAPTASPTATARPQYTPSMATFTPAPAATPVLVETATLTLPPPTAAAERTHKVKAGDTLLGIALEYGVTVEAIKSANNMADDTIYLDDVLIIPAQTAAPTATPIPEGTGIVHVVAANETLGEIALKYGVTTDALLKANDLDSADFIQVGQKLIVPGGVITPTVAP